MLDRRLQLGNCPDTLRQVWLPLEELKEKAWHVLGRPGAGKTFFLRHLGVRFINRELPLFVLDLKGDVHDYLVPYCVKQRLHRRTRIVDPADVQAGPCMAPAINGFDEPLPPDKVAGRMLTAFKALFRKRNEYQPNVEDSARFAFQLLAATRQADGRPWTVYETEEILVQGKSPFRDALFSRLTPQHAYLIKRLTVIEDLKASDQALRFAPVQTRVAALRYGDPMRAILGQATSTIDFDWLLANAGIFLLRGFEADRDRSELDFLAAVCLEKIKGAFRRRPKADWKQPAYILIDEAHRLVSGGAGDDLLECIDELRSYGANLILSHQGVSQLIPPGDPGDHRLRDSVLGRTRIKVYFSTGHRDADEDLQGEVFADQLPEVLRERKHTVTTKWLRPVLGTAATHVHTEGQSGGSGHGLSVTQPNVPPGIGGGLPVTTRSTHDADATSSAESTVEGPFYYWHVEEQESGVTFVDENEAKARFVKALVSQPDRHFVFKLGAHKAISLMSADVPALNVHPCEIEAFKRTVYATSARPAAEVLGELESRVAGFLEAHRQAVDVELERREREAELSGPEHAGAAGVIPPEVAGEPTVDVAAKIDARRRRRRA